jgi:stage V sporulation protein AB
MSVREIAKQTALFLTGASGGALVAAGVFAFITILGLVPRLAARTHTACQVKRYENWIIAGAFFGNLVNLFKIPLWGGYVVMAFWGVCSGIFVGCLVMSLAETLDTVPVINRRIRLSVGLQYVIAGIGLGKTVGSLWYFFYNIAA